MKRVCAVVALLVVSALCFAAATPVRFSRRSGGMRVLTLLNLWAFVVPGFVGRRVRWTGGGEAWDENS